LGYHGTRQPGHTPVYRLALDTWAIETLHIQGPGPGWIFGHRAERVAPGVIQIRAGEAAVMRGAIEVLQPAVGAYTLDLNHMNWQNTETSH